MMRHASTQVNHNQVKEPQQVTQPQEHTHAHTHALPREGGTRRAQSTLTDCVQRSATKLTILAKVRPIITGSSNIAHIRITHMVQFILNLTQLSMFKCRLCA